MRQAYLILLMFAGSSQTFANDRSNSASIKVDTPAESVGRFIDGKATISKRLDGGDFRVTVKTTKTGNGPIKEGFRWGGEDTSAPPTLITSFTVESGADKIFIPLSAYSDLGDPRIISLKSNSEGFELDIRGGDAGLSYNAVLVFENGWLIRRRVAHGEFPDQAWEETKYAYNTFDDR